MVISIKLEVFHLAFQKRRFASTKWAPRSSTEGIVNVLLFGWDDGTLSGGDWSQSRQDTRSKSLESRRISEIQ